MRVAPSFQIDCGPQEGWRVAQQALYAITAATILGWALAWAEVGVWPTAALALAVGLAAAVGAGRALRASVSRLGWDGAQWSLQSAGQVPETGQAEVMLDLGAWMLLRFRPEPSGIGSDRWLALDRRQAGAAWHTARVALFAALPQGAQPAATDGARPAA